MLRRIILCAAFAVFSSVSLSGFAAQPEGASVTVPAAGSIEVGFTPNKGSEALVLKVIDSAQHSIKVASYSFTSATVTEALLHAKKRGVNIWIVADSRDNTGDSKTGKAATAAFNALALAGADVRKNGNYSIMHNKFIVVDDSTVETGSFNYTGAAAHSNAENVIVNWGNPPLAAIYANEWLRLYNEADVFRPGY